MIPDLAPREAELLRRCAEEGASYRLLAHDWGVSEVTVRVYGHRLLKKLGAESIAHAVWMAYRPPEPDVECPLEARELEVLRLSANGLDSYAIAAEMGLARETVNKVFQAAYRRMGVHRQAHAVAVAVARGWIRPDEIRVTPDTREEAA